MQYQQWHKLVIAMTLILWLLGTNACQASNARLTNDPIRLMDTAEHKVIDLATLDLMRITMPRKTSNRIGNKTELEAKEAGSASWVLARIIPGPESGGTATGEHPKGTKIWYPLAEIGPSWNHYQDVFRWRWSFGMSVTGGDFICERMVSKPNHGFVVSRNVRAKQCGMSDAGLLVTTDIDPATGLHVTPHPPQEVPEAINDVWPSSTSIGDELDRTAIAWSTNGDFFLICGRAAGATTPSTYDDMANFIINTLPNDPNVLPFHVSIKTGMMVDGGGASTLSYLKTGNNPAHGELLPTGAARATSHLCTMIGVYTP